MAMVTAHEKLDEADSDNDDGEPLPMKRKGSSSSDDGHPEQEERAHQLQHRMSSQTLATM